MPDQNKYLPKLAGQHVLIVGGSAGIGYAVAEAALEHGAEVTISSSNPVRVAAAREALSVAYPSRAASIRGIVCDLSDEDGLETAIPSLVGHLHADVDHLAYTAGNAIPPISVRDVTAVSLRAAATVRYTALLLLVKYIIPRLRPGVASSITLTTGVGLDKPLSGWSGVLGPRVAVVGFAKALALDIKPIRVNTVAVGIVNTDQFARLGTGEREQRFEAIQSRLTTGRVPLPEDVAEAYLYCMKDRNATGSVIATNGGMLLM